MSGTVICINGPVHFVGFMNDYILIRNARNFKIWAVCCGLLLSEDENTTMRRNVGDYLPADKAYE